MNELKECPHCGKSVAELTNCADVEGCANFESCDNCGWQCVVCNANAGGCGASGGYAPSAEEAVAAWNHRPTPENKPLTLDQLRQMSGEPVYIVYPSSPEYNEWKILKGLNDEPDCDGDTGAWFNDDEWQNLKFLGDDWLAYAHKPEV